MRSIRVTLAGGLLTAALAGILFAQVYDAGTELALVERVQKARGEYVASLTELCNYYLNTGDVANARRAEREIGNFRAIEQYNYATKVPGAAVEGPIAVLRAISEANDYYVDALIINESRHKARKDLALQRYGTILDRWPDSDKAPLAAFEMGETYSSYYYKDYDIAAQHYKKAYDLNPAIEKPALVKAGDMYVKLERYPDAVAMYKLAAENSRSVADRAEAQRMLDRLAKMGY